MLEVSEVGREQFGDFPNFVKAFPEDYQFYFCKWHSSLINRMIVRPANETDFINFAGNVFCIPAERGELFAEVAGI